MDHIKLKKEEAAFYFNQAAHNFQNLNDITEEQYKKISQSDKKRAKAALENLFSDPAVLQKTVNFIFNFKDAAKNPRNEIEALILKFVDLRNYFSHYIHTDQVLELSGGEKNYIERYYQISMDATSSRDTAINLFQGNRLTDGGVLFLLCMFLKKSQANKLIGSISGFKRNDPVGQPRRNLFTYYSVREGYKVVPDMQKHFLLFTLVNQPGLCEPCG